MSKIRLTTKDVNRLIAWRDNGHKTAIRTNRYFAFPKGEIVVVGTGNEGIVSKVEFNLVKENTFEFAFYRAHPKNGLMKICDFTFELLESWGSLGKVIDTSFSKYIYNPQVQRTHIEDVLAIYFVVNYYAIYNKSMKVVKPMSQRTSRSEPTRKIGKTKYAVSPIKLTKVVTSNGGVISSDGVKRGFYQFHKKEWEVRGFIRTYKSGKQVWIKPSTRKRQLETKEIIAFNDETEYTI